MESKSLFTKDNVTFALALLGSIGTLISWIYIYVSQRAKIKLSVFSYSVVGKKCLMYMMFENRSRLPISITRLSIVDQDIKCDCRKISTLVSKKTSSVGEEIYEQKLDYSLSIPIYLEPLAAISGYVFFGDSPLPSLTNAKSLTFEVCTNRGTLKQIQLELPEATRHP